MHAARACAVSVGVRTFMILRGAGYRTLMEKQIQNTAGKNSTI